MTSGKFIPLSLYRELPLDEMKKRAESFRIDMLRRRSVRSFSQRPVLREVVEDCLRVAGSAPSGANLQPWHFMVVSDPAVKRRIREAAEREEKKFYQRRATREMLDALEPFGTDWSKPFLEDAPYVIVIFAETYRQLPDGKKAKNYHVSESVGIATGMLITALHHAGLVSLTHTPSPMNFLNAILGRPDNEKPFLILVVGYPAEGVRVPDISKKSLEDISTFI